VEQAFNYTTFVTVSAVTMILVEIAKKVHVNINRSYLPYMALIIAAVLNAVIGLIQAAPDFQNYNMAGSLIAGISSGIGAMGGYDALTTLFIPNKTDTVQAPETGATAETLPRPEAAEQNWEPGDA